MSNATALGILSLGAAAALATSPLSGLGTGTEKRVQPPKAADISAGAGKPVKRPALSAGG